MVITSIYRVWPHFLIQNPWWHNIDCKSACVRLKEKCSLKWKFCHLFTPLMSVTTLTFQVCSCMKVCLWGVLNIRRLLNSFLSLSLSHSLHISLQLLSHHLARLWFLHACSSDAYGRVCMCAEPLPDPSFPSSRLVHSGCRCSAICSVSVQGQLVTIRDPH